MGTAHPNICPYQAFHASDRPFILAAGNDRSFRRTCEVVGHAEWADDPRFATNQERVRHRDELDPAPRRTPSQRRPLPSGSRSSRRLPFPAPRSGRWTRSSHRPKALHRGVGARRGTGDDASPRPESHPIRRPGPGHEAGSAAARRTHRRGHARDVTALERWRQALESWAIPPRSSPPLPESPYGFPAELFRTRGERTDDVAGPSPTTERALEGPPRGGPRTRRRLRRRRQLSPLAGRAGVLVGVDAQEDMLAGFLANARAAGVEAEAVHGRWPDVADRVRQVDVAVVGHVLYNVADLEPFARSFATVARRRVVYELTERHPLHWMNDSGSGSMTWSAPMDRRPPMPWRHSRSSAAKPGWNSGRPLREEGGSSEEPMPSRSSVDVSASSRVATTS